MKTAIDQLKHFVINDLWVDEITREDLILEIDKLKQTELDQLRAAYNNSCHDISFDEYYRNKYERKEQISPEDMGDNKEA